MTLSALSVFAITLIIAAGSPGPSIAALVARVLNRGIRDVLPFVVAMWVGEAVWLTFAVAGLSVIAHSFAIVFTALKYAGAAYLLFIAWKMWNAPADVRDTALPTARRPWQMFVAGLLVTFGNPKIMLFYLALLPTLIDLGHVDTLAWGELVATMVAVLALVDFAWAIAASKARRFLRSPRAVRIANRTSATVMGGAAVAIASR